MVWFSSCFHFAAILATNSWYQVINNFLGSTSPGGDWHSSTIFDTISEYADELKKNLMFNLPKNTLKETFDRYSAKAPDSLTSQFPK